MRPEFAKLQKMVKKADPEGDEKFLRKAYRVADKAHQGQQRLSGEPYISHTLEVAKILAGFGMDTKTVSAALLHDVIEDTDLTREDLEEDFGKTVARLVDGVTKIGAMHVAEAPVSDELKQAENLRKMLVATAQDVRVVLIKLADRLHNMRTIEFLPKEKIRRISQETLDIYAPIANRMGLSQWQWELEDHAFHHLYPKEYQDTAKAVAMRRRERERELDRILAFLEERLKEAEVNARVIGRPKHLYSIYKKMVEGGKTFGQVSDIMAIRIVTQTVSGCYNALGVVHHVWPPVRGRFKDYIAAPKLNMYQSIHSTVTIEGGMPLEVQIRTEEMDRASREGIAAHWIYKDAQDQVDSTSEKQLLWLKQMLGWLKDVNAPEELMDGIRRDISMTSVYVYTPRTEIMELPQGATPLDFAYAIHSDIGHTCVGAKVNGSMVPLRYHLQNSDVVEILTSKNQTPHLDWLDVVVTGRARTRIRQRLRDSDELPRGKEGPGESRSVAPVHRSRLAKQKVQVVDDETRRRRILVEGQHDIAVTFAKCCDPMPGQPVIGYVTKRHAATVHRVDCKLLESKERDPSRMLAASWEGEQVVEYALRVTVGSRPNALADITGAVRPLNVDMTRANYLPGENGDCVFEFAFRTNDSALTTRAEKALLQVPGVRAVEAIAEPETVTAAN